MNRDIFYSPFGLRFLMIRVDWVRLHLNVFLDLLLLVSEVILIATVVAQFIFEEFSVSQSWKFLTQLHIFIVTIMIAAPFIKTHVFCIRKVFGSVEFSF